MTRNTSQRTLSPQPSGAQEPYDRPTLSPRKRSNRMASDKGDGMISDADSSERPVREQLKKASIAALPEEIQMSSQEPPVEADAGAAEEASDDQTVSTDARGRLQRKRSFEEVEGDQSSTQATEMSTRHTRKRSRDSTAEEALLKNGKSKVSGEAAREEVNSDVLTVSNGDITAEAVRNAVTPPPDKTADAAVEAMASPKIKRSRLHSDAVKGIGTLATEQPSSGAAQGPSEIQSGDTVDPTAQLDRPEAAQEPAVKATEIDIINEEEQVTKIPPSSGFASTSAVSPFGALAGSKSPSAEPQTAPSAFATSAFGALSGSTTSAFGAVGKSAGLSSFASGSKSPEKAEPAPAKSALTTFASAASQGAASPFGSAAGSAFGAGAAGFGSSAAGFGSGGFSSGLGGGFSSLGGGGLNSFASAGKPGVIGGSSKPGKAFGAPVDDEDAEDEDAGDLEAGIRSPRPAEEEKKDDRFYEQSLETGEEGETMLYSCRAKLYNFVKSEDGTKKEWKERGLGTLRLNVKNATGDEEDSAVSARLLMRADGSHRVVLNTPVKKEIKFGAPTGGPPAGGYVYFMGSLEAKPTLELLQLKMRQQFALELYERLSDLQKDM